MASKANNTITTALCDCADCESLRKHQLEATMTLEDEEEDENGDDR